MAKHLVLVGGGHAHLRPLTNLADYTRRGHKVTLISPDTHHYYSGMGPGMLSRSYSPEQVRFHVKKLAEDRGAVFVLGKVVRVKPDERLLYFETGETLPYDVVSFNTGSFVSTDLFEATRNIAFTVKPIVNLIRAQKNILQLIQEGTPNLVVVGGGPAGVELAGNLHRLVLENKGAAHITLVSGGTLLPALPEKAGRLARKSLLGRNIHVLENARLSRVEEEYLLLDEGARLPSDMTFLAWGVRPSPIFKESRLPVGPDGGLLVNDYLQSVAFHEIFGGGDCVSFEHPLDKVGVYAVRQGDVLHHNLSAALENRPMRRFEPQKAYLQILNLGDETGIMIRKSCIWHGRLPWVLKDYIDRRFMRKFQISGEMNDPIEALD